MEARVGFEPTNGGFADLSLGPLGYRAKRTSNKSEINSIKQTSNKNVGARFSASLRGFEYNKSSPVICHHRAPAGRHPNRQRLLSFGRRRHARFPQKSRRFFRRSWVDIKSRSPLESRHLRQFRNDL